MDKIYKKVEIDGKTFIEVTSTYTELFPISKYETRKDKAQELLNLKVGEAKVTS